MVSNFPLTVPWGAGKHKSPLLWVRLDPQDEWLASIAVQQPEPMLLAQLHTSRDVPLQLAAVAGERCEHC